jgi:hypothetical protein
MIIQPPLLALAEGRKVRPRREPAPKPLEIILHVTIADLLRQHALPDWDWTHINRKAKDAREGKILKTMGVNPHWPDFMLVSPNGLVRFLELKRIGEPLSDGQDAFRVRCIQRGIPYVVARTLDDALGAFDDWGCLRIKYEARA